MASAASRPAPQAPWMMASHRPRNHTGGHQAAAAGWRSKSGMRPSVAINTVACTNNDARANARFGKTLSRTPWQASRLKNTKTQAPPVAAKFAAILTSVDGFSCQTPELAAAKIIAQGRFSANTKAAKASSSAPDFARKIWRALRGNPANARQSRRLGNSDCHTRAVSSAVMAMAIAINVSSSARISP